MASEEAIVDHLVQAVKAHEADGGWKGLSGGAWAQNAAGNFGVTVKDIYRVFGASSVKKLLLSPRVKRAGLIVWNNKGAPYIYSAQHHKQVFQEWAQKWSDIAQNQATKTRDEAVLLRDAVLPRAMIYEGTVVVKTEVKQKEKRGKPKESTGFLSCPDFPRIRVYMGRDVGLNGMKKGDACTFSLYWSSSGYVGLRAKAIKSLGRAPLSQDELAEQSNRAMNRQDTEDGYGQIGKQGQIVTDDLNVTPLYVPTGARVGDRVHFFHSNGVANKIELLRGWEKEWDALQPHEVSAAKALGLTSSEAWEEFASPACLTTWAELAVAERDAAQSLGYDEETWVLQQFAD